MKKVIAGVSVFVAGGLVFAGLAIGNDANSKESVENSQPKEEVIVVDDKHWEDKTDKSYYDPSRKGGSIGDVHHFIEYQKKAFNGEAMKQSEVEDDFQLYGLYKSEAYATIVRLEQYTVEGVSIEKDFENMRQLSEIIIEEEEARHENIPEDLEIKTEDGELPISEYSEYIEEPSERHLQAIEYIQKLTQDLYDVINEKVEAEHGFAYQADGGKVEELEAFLNGDIAEEARSVKAREVDPKEWKDISSADDLEKPDFSANVNDWVTETLDILSQDTDPKLIESGHDEGYDMYLKAMSVTNVLGLHIRVEGIDLEKDFENLSLLSSYINHLQFVRTAHIDPNGHETENKVAVDEWKPANEDFIQSFEYMKQLLHDIDIAINKDGEGETYGLTNQLDGEHVGELESFIRGN